jgi:hypothetical protein
MPRQPYMRVVPQPKGAKIDVGTHVIGSRPELENQIAHCLMAWPHVEAEMALFLGQLLGAQNVAALAVFQALRRSSSQREAISEAAKATLNDEDQEILSAVLNFHKSIEAERNALSHGHFGTSTKLPDDFIWMTTKDYIAARSPYEFGSPPRWDDEAHAKLLQSVWVYRKSDLTKILQDMKELAHIWFNLRRYAQAERKTADKRAELYHQLCDEPHIAQELLKLRRAKNPSGNTPQV